MKTPPSSSSTSSPGAAFCSSIAKKARFSPLLLLALALFLLCFSFLYGEDLTELLGRQARVPSQLVVSSSSSRRSNGGDEQPAAPPPGNKHQNFQNSFQ